ncbi:class I SAM-dependent methyltransferase [Patiriisocius marinus]|uniref:2-polyprenyl-3-methyl-5-hydroxy-6-metoxy-1,4-benz oquinol methylase n=1 Tax=Patiriisocius marinus TaxID=1397112 RepID=A0A5J4IVR9_9FLAO|nr:class I SAM-dependent methyltransferase [Patiriisocius marinus]GER58966.1 2-polyprenyl-3-methyl-5-hydroxy-6-metoxy-1,4-benz oquinol methylase [Patiriisocius marinus]
MKPCLLCNKTDTILFYKHKDRTFSKCLTCGSVFLDPLLLPSIKDEQNRYLLHENHVEDQGYILFVTPLIEEITSKIVRNTTGLDFGSGPTPIIALLLSELGYEIKKYDPFFCNKPEVFNLKYDFIVSCEVIEHLHSPLKEFKKLYASLKPGAILFCMTDLLPSKSKFGNWYYKNDFTHVIFYSQENLEWIKDTCGFKSLEITNRVIKLIK